MYLLAICYLFFSAYTAAPLNNTQIPELNAKRLKVKLEFDVVALTGQIATALWISRNRERAVKNTVKEAFNGAGQVYNVMVYTSSGFYFR